MGQLVFWGLWCWSYPKSNSHKTTQPLWWQTSWTPTLFKLKGGESCCCFSTCLSLLPIYLITTLWIQCTSKSLFSVKNPTFRLLFPLKFSLLLLDFPQGKRERGNTSAFSMQRSHLEASGPHCTRSVKFSGKTPRHWSSSLCWSQSDSFTPISHPSSCQGEKGKDRQKVCTEWKTSRRAA